MTTPVDRSAPSRQRLVLGLVAVLALVAGGLVWFFSGSEPAAVDIDDAVAGADDAAAQGSDAGGATSAAAGVEGTWTVDTAVQEFVFDEGSGTWVGFRIDEELSSIGATEAVGRTPGVVGELVVEGTTVTAAAFTADVAALTTDDGRRDRRARAAIGSDTLTFELTEPIDLGAEPTPGDSVSATATGDLTVNGTTASVQVPLDAALSETGVLVVTGSFEVLLSDYGVTAPSAPIVLSVSDRATVELQLYLTRSGAS